MAWRHPKPWYTLDCLPFTADTPRRAIDIDTAVQCMNTGFAYDSAAYREQISDPPEHLHQISSSPLPGSAGRCGPYAIARHER